MQCEDDEEHGEIWIIAFNIDLWEDKKRNQTFFVFMLEPLDDVSDDFWNILQQDGYHQK